MVTCSQALHNMGLSDPQDQINALAGFDNFHMRGTEATRVLTEKITSSAEDHLCWTSVSGSVAQHASL